LKEFQERELALRLRDTDIASQEGILNRKLEDRVKNMSEEHDKLKGEQERMSQVRAAYNADKRALVERISELEDAIR
jgi:hypothetical protein